MEKPIITIGREYGAGGHTVAKALSQQLGIPAYDKEIIKITAEESGLTESILQRTEESDGLGNLISWFLPSGGLSSYDRAILAQAQVIRNLAAQGPCIIVGRGADYILRDLPQVINVFLYADPADKLQYAMDTYGDTREQAARRFRRNVGGQHIIAGGRCQLCCGKRRSTRDKAVDQNGGDLKNYHLTLNTSPVGKLACAELILQYARQAMEAGKGTR